MPDFEPGQLIIYIVVLLFAISAHEAAHAWMSNRFGDDTARLLGRITLNPIAHTDPIGTLLIPIVNFFMASAGIGFGLIGWGKPTPVNPLRWRNKDLANVMVSAAGIMANFAIALTALLIIKILQYSGVVSYSTLLGSVSEPLSLFLLMTLTMNVSLVVFNLLPIPPLDGSKILETFMPASFQPVYSMLEHYSYVILLLGMYFGIFGYIYRPIMYVVMQLVTL
jgi:Zn-dependent protease